MLHPGVAAATARRQIRFSFQASTSSSSTMANPGPGARGWRPFRQRDDWCTASAWWAQWKTRFIPTDEEATGPPPKPPPERPLPASHTGRGRFDTNRYFSMIQAGLPSCRAFPGVGGHGGRRAGFYLTAWERRCPFVITVTTSAETAISISTVDSPPRSSTCWPKNPPSIDPHSPDATVATNPMG